MTSESIAPIEIGSFTSSIPQKTEFIGSASGVFFVNTVFRAFARSASSASIEDANPHSELSARGGGHGSVNSRLLDPNMPTRPEDENLVMRIELDNSTARTPSSSAGRYGIRGHGLGKAPSQSLAQELLKSYLRNWHPLFPFLHGPSLLDTILLIYEQESPPAAAAATQTTLRTRLCRAVICQCVFNIAALDRTGNSLTAASRIESSSQLLTLLGFLASSHDTQSLQALLAAQLYLVCTMSLRAASTVGGTLTRVIYHAGFHRCPSRYSQIPAQECDIRKRIFWSAYTLDRYLSQSLGHPLSIQDSDVDVCIPGLAEIHKRVPAHTHNLSTALTTESEVLDHMPQQTQTVPILNDDNPSDGEKTSNTSHATNAHQDGAGRSEILGHYVLYCQLTGQALELLHKSIQNRTINRDSVMEIQSNVHAWWNELPRRLQDEYSGGTVQVASSFTFFFNTIYNQLLLLINRPFLSLPPQSLEFRTSLQSCISASRQIITTSRHQLEWDLLVPWPGMLSTKWMAGLVLSFACTLSLYPIRKAQQEIEDCVQQLMAIDQSWNNARHCAAALRSLLEHLNHQHDGGSKRQSLSFNTTSFAGNATARQTHMNDLLNVQEVEGMENQPTKRVRYESDRDRPSFFTSPSTGLQTNTGDINELSANDAMRAGVKSPSIIPSTDDTWLSFGPEDRQGQYEDIFGMPMTSDSFGNINGGFGYIGWESMANNWDSMQDSAPWGLPSI